MKKKIFILGVFLCIALAFFGFKRNTRHDAPTAEKAKDAPESTYIAREPIATPFAMPQVPEAAFPNRTCLITDYGAIGDGQVLNTASFKSAIADCAGKGGGHVVVPSGMWLSGPIRLASNIDLHLEEGSKILFSDRFSDYLPVVFTRFEGIELYNYSPFIYAADSTNIALTGKGELDGNAEAWLKWNDDTQNKISSRNRLYAMALGNTPVSKRIFGTPEDAFQPSFIEFIRCDKILVDGIKITNSPSWTFHPVYSENIIVRNMSIDTKNRNTDGIVIDSSQNVIIQDSELGTGDDAVVIKSGKDQDGWRVGRPSQNIIIHDLDIKRGNSGISIGSEMSGGVKNVLVYNINIQVVDFGVRFKSTPGRGGIVEKIWMDNIFMKRADSGAILIDLDYGTPIKGYNKDRFPVFRDIDIKNVECRRSKNAISLIGLPESPLSNISLENVSIHSSKGVTFKNIESKTFKNVNVTVKGKPLPIE